MKAMVFPILAILAIMTMEIVALCHGIDGIALTASATAIGGIAGYYYRHHKK